MSLTLKAATVLFAIVSSSGPTSVSNDPNCQPKCASRDRATVTAAKTVSSTADCEPQCDPPECAAKCPTAEQASCEKPATTAPVSRTAALTCEKR